MSGKIFEQAFKYFRECLSKYADINCIEHDMMFPAVPDLRVPDKLHPFSIGAGVIPNGCNETMRMVSQSSNLEP